MPKEPKLLDFEKSLIKANPGLKDAIIKIATERQNTYNNIKQSVSGRKSRWLSGLIIGTFLIPIPVLGSLLGWSIGRNINTGEYSRAINDAEAKGANRAAETASALLTEGAKLPEEYIKILNDESKNKCEKANIEKSRLDPALLINPYEQLNYAQGLVKANDKSTVGVEVNNSSGGINQAAKSDPKPTKTQANIEKTKAFAIRRLTEQNKAGRERV